MQRTLNWLYKSTSVLIYFLSILKLSRKIVQECDWIANRLVQMFMNSVCTYVCLLSIMIFKIMLMTGMLVLMKVHFSLLYVEWRKWMPKNVIELWLKCKNRYWIWFMRKYSLFHANACIFALLVAVSCKWMRIFS